MGARVFGPTLRLRCVFVWGGGGADSRQSLTAVQRVLEARSAGARLGRALEVVGAARGALLQHRRLKDLLSSRDADA